MLKHLLREIGRSWASPPKQRQPANVHAERQQRFVSGTREEQRALATELRLMLDGHPDDLIGWTLLGDWSLSLGALSDAEDAYRRGLGLSPTHARAQEGLGLALLKMGRLEEANHRLEAAARAEPMNSDIWTHWGLVDLEMRRIDAAADKFQRAVERDPNNAHAWHNWGITSYRQGQADRAIEQIQRSLALKPEHGLAYSNLALALRRSDRLDEALAAAERATQLKRDSARVWVVLSDLHIDRADFQQAEQALARALQIDSSHVGTYVGRGKLFTAMRRYAEAEAAYRQALVLEPGQADAEGGLAEVQLLLGQWAPGWDLHEARRRTDSSPVRDMPLPEWDGQPLPSGTGLLIHSEQGMGDIILFASCIPDLLTRGIHCVIEVRPRLHALFVRSFPGATVIPNEGNDRSLAWLPAHESIAQHVPIGTLPRWLRRTDEAFPRHTGYLRAAPDRTRAWRQRLDAELPPGGPLIGIAWKGGLAMTAKHQRSLGLPQLLAALAPTGARFVNLQYGDVDAELAAAQRNLGVNIHPGLSGYGDLDDVAALTAACDGIVTVCSTQAHLTGALGHPGLVLVPSNPSWRYGATGTTSPWYPSLRSIRQSASGDWATALDLAAEWVAQQSFAGVIEHADANTLSC
ncbi:MAG: tetratricopeptide repeat-containing glycosyltransferase family protein [Burkholderiales bacterium]